MTKYYKVTAENGTVFGRSVSNPDKKVVCATSIIAEHVGWVLHDIMFHTVEPTRKYDLRYEPVEITAKEYREILKNLKKLNVYMEHNKDEWGNFIYPGVGFKNGYEGAVWGGTEMLVKKLGGG